MVSKTAKLDRQIVRARTALKELYFKKKELLRQQKENRKDRLEQVFELAAGGKSVNEIARAMRIEHGTVYEYLRNAPHWLALARLHKEHPETDSRWNAPGTLTAEEKQKIVTWEQEFLDVLAPLKRKR
jgi:DNA-binding NarL/FixJ family response regulator